MIIRVLIMKISSDLPRLIPQARRTIALLIFLLPVTLLLASELPEAGFADAPQQAHIDEATVADLSWCPSDTPICRVRRQWSVADLQDKLDVQDWAAWQDGDQLVFAYHGNAAEVYLAGGIESPLMPVGDSGYWVTAIRVDQLDHAIVTHWLNVRSGTSEEIIAETFGVWRGKHAPPAPPLAAPLQGAIGYKDIYSPELDQVRGVTYYLPPDYADGQRYPVVYMTDGESMVAFAQVAEPLITRGRIPPLILVGAHSAGQDEGRTREYLLGWDEQRYLAHETFYTETLREWAENHLNASRDPADRALFGYSSGAAFAGNTGIRKPGLYGYAMMFSPAQPPELTDSIQTDTRYYLLAGTLEESFYDAAQRSFWGLLQQKIDAVFNRRVAGHDFVMWQEEFARALNWFFDRD